MCEVMTHWSKHNHQNYLLTHLAAPPNNKNNSLEVLQFVATKNGLGFSGNVLGVQNACKNSINVFDQCLHGTFREIIFLGNKGSTVTFFF